MELIEQHDRQIENLRMQWKRFPALMASIRELKEVLKYPEKYTIKVGDKDVRELESEVDSRHPLASFTVFVELPVTSKTPFGTPNYGDEKNILQVTFSLGKTISEPTKDEFDTSVIFLSGNGESLSGRLEAQVQNGKINTLDKTLTSDQNIWISTLTGMMEDNYWKLKGFKATLWTGLSGEIHKKTAEAT